MHSMDAFNGCSKLKYVFYAGSTEMRGDIVFTNCNALEMICASPDYAYSLFCGEVVLVANSLCERYRDAFNHCYKGYYDDDVIIGSEKRDNVTKWEELSTGCLRYKCENDTGGIIENVHLAEWQSLKEQDNQCYDIICEGNSWMFKKMDNATEWEEQSNNCVHYECNNVSGFISWSMCNSTDEVRRICIEGNCHDDEQVPLTTDIISVEIKIETNETAGSIVDITEQVSAITGISKDEFTIGLETDEEGHLICVIVYVNGSEKAEIIANSIETTCDVLDS